MITIHSCNINTLEYLYNLHINHDTYVCNKITDVETPNKFHVHVTKLRLDVSAK